MNNKDTDFQLEKMSKKLARIADSGGSIGLARPLRRGIQRKSTAETPPERAVAGKSSQMISPSSSSLLPSQIHFYIIKFLKH